MRRLCFFYYGREMLLCPKIYSLIALTAILIFGAFDAECETVDLGCPTEIRPKIAIALGGGGARGIAQTGVLSVFEREGIKIDDIVGTSIGAIIGGLYSSGYSLDEIDSITRSIAWSQIFLINNSPDRNEYYFDRKQLEERSIISLKFNKFKFVMPEGVSAGERLSRYLQLLFWQAPYFSDRTFDSLKYPFRAVATDLTSGRTYIFRDGNLINAVRASSTFPVMFYPVKLDDRVLIDGGIMANIPVHQAEEFSPDMIIAVKSASPLKTRTELNNLVIVADQTVSVAMKYFEDEAEKRADCLIEPQIGNWKNTDFSDPAFLYNAGRKAAEDALAEINRRISEYRDSAFAKKLQTVFPADNSVFTVNASGLTEKDAAEFEKIKSGCTQKILIDFIKKLNLYSDIKISNNGGEIELTAEMFPKYDRIKLISAHHEVIDSLETEINSKYSGKIFDKAETDACISDILKMLIKRNYLRATVQTCSSNPIEEGTMSLEVRIPVLGNLEITGNRSIGSYLIRKEFLLKRGDFINCGDLTRSWENIYNSGWFYSVAFNFANRPGDDTVDLQIRVSEIGTQELNLGMLSNDERGTRLGLDMLQENLFNMGTRLNLHFVGGKKDIFTGLLLEQPRIFNSYFSLRTEGYYRYKRIPRFEYVPKFSDNTFKYIAGTEQGTQELGIKIAFGRQLEHLGKIDAEMRFARQRYYDWDISGKDKPDWYYIGTLKVEGIFDSENNPYFPTSGRVINLSLETNVMPVDNVDKVSFTKAIASYRGNIGFGRSTITGSMLFGSADINTPLPEEFDFGGQEKFFGLHEYNETGKQIVSGQLEYRYKMPFKLFFDTYASLRYDLGNVWKSMDAMNFSDIKQGLGVSIMFDTPIGPAKFSVGRCFFYSEEPTRLIIGDTKFYFSIGTKL